MSSHTAHGPLLPRVALVLCLGLGAIALSPRTARAGSLMCNAAGNCLESERPCSYYYLYTTFGHWTCFFSPIAMRLPVALDSDGGATVEAGDKKYRVMSDALLAKFDAYGKRARGGASAHELAGLRKELNAGFDSNLGHRVSDARLRAVTADIEASRKK